MGDFTYRTREEVDAWKQRCPILRLRSLAPQLKDRFDQVEAEVLELVREAREFAEKSPIPDASTATTHVYSEPIRVQSALPEKSPTTVREITFSQARSKLSRARCLETRAFSSWAKASENVAGTFERLRTLRSLRTRTPVRHPHLRTRICRTRRRSSDDRNTAGR